MSRNVRSLRVIFCRSIIVLMLLTAAHSALADLIITPGVPAVNTSVRIEVVPAFDGQTLLILSPSATYRFIGGLDDDMTFIPAEPGEHDIRVLVENRIVEQRTITVADSGVENTSLSAAPPDHPILEMTSVRTGEPIIINAPIVGVQRISVLHAAGTFSTSDRQRPVTYLPEMPGVYDITVEYTDGSVWTGQVSAVGERAPYATMQGNADPGIDSVTDAAIDLALREDRPFSLPGDGTAPLRTADGSVVQADIVLRRDGAVVRRTTTELLAQEPIADGRYDLEAKLFGTSLRSMRLRDLRTRPGLTIHLEEVDPVAVRGGHPEAIAAFAFDPAGSEFLDGTIEFVAAGNALYKCRAYNFTTRTCTGEHVKMLDTIPGRTYQVTVSPEDPLFSQTGYLTNPNFDTTTSGWTTTSSGTTPTFSWVASDGGQSGIAQANLSTKNRQSNAYYYQRFNLTIPSGTTLVSVNISALWRTASYSLPGYINVTVQNAARATTYCNQSVAFTGTTSWASVALRTGTANCPLGNFTPNTNYTINLMCRLVVANVGGAQEACRWDNVSIVAWYNDTTAPVLRNITDAPDPVDFGTVVNITVNVTDNIDVDTVFVEFDGINHTMTLGGGDVYHYDAFNTARTPGVYFYKIFANDTNGNWASNTSVALNITIRDAQAPNITLIAPLNDTVVNAIVLVATYNVTDQVAASVCWLVVDGTTRNTTMSPPLATTLTISAALPTDGQYLWNVSCNDTSMNTNTSETRRWTRDTSMPTVLLDTADALFTNSTAAIFSFTPIDATIANCTLFSNFSGSWSANQTILNPVNGSSNSFPGILLAHGSYRWNVRCEDRAGNGAFNATNRTYNVDIVAPEWSSLIAAPASGASYAPSGAYRFNSTWTDNFTGVHTVLFESNMTGTLANSTPTQAGTAYSTAWADLPAGTYQYRWYANDTARNRNSTSVQSYTIARAPTVLNLTLNGSQQNRTVAIGDMLMIQGSIVTPASGYVELYIDSTLVVSGSSPVTNTSTFTEERRYNITLIYPMTQNYTQASSTLFVDVADTTPPRVVLDVPANDTLVGQNVTFWFTPSDNVDIGNCTIALDGVLNATRDVPNNMQSNITITYLAEGIHVWDVNCSDITNNTAVNGTPQVIDVDSQPPTSFSLQSPVSGTIASVLTVNFSWQPTIDAHFSNYTISIDNDPGFASVNYQSTIDNATNTSAIISILDQAIWYWHVLAKDRAGNAMMSLETFNYTADAVPPTITDRDPGNDTYQNTTSVTFSYTPNDFTDIQNCSLWVNGTRHQTDTTIERGVQNTFIETFANEDYDWHLTCVDSANNTLTTETYLLSIDLAPPTSFLLFTPVNGSVINTNVPTYAWQQTIEEHFANYTIEISDDESFVYANYTLTTTGIANTSVVQSPPLQDGLWYWRVIARDLAGNSIIIHPSFTVDTTPPSAFDLLTPSNGTQATNMTPTFTWEQSNDPNFKNYTLLISDSPSFSWVNATNATLGKTLTSASLELSENVIWYWRVIAYDEANLSRNSTNTFIYITDTRAPNVTLIAPQNATTITTSSLVNFQYNATDIGLLANCSLYLDDAVAGTVNAPPTNVTNTISTNVENGEHTWFVSCMDAAGNAANSTVRNLTLDVTTPSIRLFESSTANYVASARINLSYQKDAVENQVSFSVSPTTVVTLVNATLELGGSGMIIYNDTLVNFSGVFSQSNNNVFSITWKLLKVNTTSVTSICQSGNDNTGGTAIGNTAKKTLVNSCTWTGGDLRMLPGENLTLTVNAYNSAGTTRTVTHFWENTSDSFVQFDGYRLGNLTVRFVNVTDPSVNESDTYVEQCNATCTDGYCLNTQVFLQLYNGSAWRNVSTTGNLTLNGTQVNPQSLGNLNTTSVVDFTLFGELHAADNSLRCEATSSYSDGLSTLKNVSVVDRLPPSVALLSPSDGIAIEQQNVTFSYEPFDRRLADCSLWTNTTGTWAVNQTMLTPSNGSQNDFEPIVPPYGIFVWNVYCYDAVGNIGYAAANRTLVLAGNLAITAEDISFSTDWPIEGASVVLYANISNLANKTERGVVAQFWNGHPDTGTQIGADVLFNVTGLNKTLVNITWIATVGTHTIFVVIDPPLGSGNIVESDEENNIANRSIDVSLWQVYFGNVTGGLLLGREDNSTFVNWSVMDAAGHIFVTDSDAINGIQWLFLQAVGRNSSNESGVQTVDDFEEIDTLLGSGGYADSVNRTFTENGLPKATATATIFNRLITEIPVVATSEGNFTTGLLWDMDDSTNAYYDSTDAEDLVFQTAIEQRYGENGLVDYEIIIPSVLKSYKAGSGTVDMYYELQ